jgi:hypothetical protein
MSLIVRYKSQPLALFVVVALAIGSTLAADGLFFQQDASKGTFVTTFSVQKDGATFGVSAFANELDEALSFSFTQSVGWYAEIGTLRIGPAIRLAYQDSALDSTDVGVKAVFEKYSQTDFGSFFWLVDASSIDNSFLLLGQFNLAKPNFSFEYSYGRSTDYSDTTFALNRRFANSRFSGRIGYRIEAEDLFFGMSYNTF